MTSPYIGSLPQWLENNKTFAKDTLPMLPEPWHMADRRGPAKASGQVTIVLTCLDPRSVPETFFGPGFDGAVIRNAGGRATDDAIRSATALRGLVNAKQIVVVHHTDCGVTHLESQEIIDFVAADGPEAKAAADKIDYKLFSSDKIEESVREDVEVFRKAPTLAGVSVHGFVLDTFTGEISPVDV